MDGYGLSYPEGHNIYACCYMSDYVATPLDEYQGTNAEIFLEYNGRLMPIANVENFCITPVLPRGDYELVDGEVINNGRKYPHDYISEWNEWVNKIHKLTVFVNTL